MKQLETMALGALIVFVFFNPEWVGAWIDVAIKIAVSGAIAYGIYLLI